MYKKILTLILIFVSVLFYFLATSRPSVNARLISPWIERGKSAVNVWFPQAIASDPEAGAPDISAKAAYFIEVNSGEVLYQKNPHLKLPVASLVKVMTAVITLENKDLQDEITVSGFAAGMEPDRMELIEGEKLTVEKLLYGVFLISANDAAEALAEGSLGSREDFIKQMNIKADQLGMKNSLFINPTGLQEDDQKQYSTAFDVVLMSRYAIKNFPPIVSISKTPKIFFPEESTHQSYELYSGINLLSTYPGVLGLKTGYTPEAGLTLVTLVKRGEYEVLGVLLNSENRREEARILLDYSFSRLDSAEP